MVKMSMVQFYGHFSAKWAKRPQTIYCGKVKDETPFRHSPAGIETQVLEIIMKYSYISQSFNWSSANISRAPIFPPKLTSLHLKRKYWKSTRMAGDL